MMATGWPRAARTAAAGLAMALLVGCSGTASRPGTAPDDYFARQLPGLPDDWQPRHSPAHGLYADSPAQVRQALLAQHKRWAGTPYRLGGASERGIDCSALMQRVFEDTFQYELPRSTHGQVHAGEPVARSELAAGDLVFFRPPGPYHHVGVYVGEGYFLHASTSRGVMLSRLDNVYWRRHYWQARRPLPPPLLAQRLAPQAPLFEAQVAHSSPPMR